MASLHFCSKVNKFGCTHSQGPFEIHSRLLKNLINSNFKHFNYQKTTQIPIISKHIKNVSKHIKTYQKTYRNISKPHLYPKFPCSASPFAEPEKNLRPWKFRWLCCSSHPWHAHWSEGKHPVRDPVPRYSCCFPPPQLGENGWKKPGRKKRKMSAN